MLEGVEFLSWSVGSISKFLAMFYGHLDLTSLRFLDVLRRERRRILLLKAMDNAEAPVDEIPPSPDTDEILPPFRDPGRL